ncbi:GrpB family protein [Labrenzia sp. PHM005]|uniref:GrpB family protein n=1 Tax=Labrenzia sp. PHM005 TaxID=2590016 RepID=UPI00113FC9C9|nr:GrpB family protein [Labrenzia sp. PHM005]QDG77741.1 GrpB family protein [Labrenzia sp. PHM005]
MVELTDYQTVWAEQYQDEAARISQVLGPNLVAIHHIGSTAVPGLVAKPIIDLMGEVNSLEASDAMNREMQFLGYEVMDAYGIPGRRYYRKFNSERRRTHHLHVFLSGSDHVTRHLAFRDYLIAHAEAAKAYADLKLRLVTIDDGDWDSYLIGKEKFIKDTERMALEWSARMGA